MTMATQMEQRSSSFPAASTKKSGRFRWLESGPTEVWQSGWLRRIYTPENPQVFPGRKGSAGRIPPPPQLSGAGRCCKQRPTPKINHSGVSPSDQPASSI
jgi:hypothetical protein